MNILITGGAGFIGSHLSEFFLNRGDSVTVVDSFLTSSKNNLEEIPAEVRASKLSIVEADVTTFDFSKLPKTVDEIFHLASPASPNHHSPISYHALPMETMMVNTVGSKNVLEFALKCNAKFLFASTSEVYGDPEVNPQPEDYRGNVSTTGPRSVYDEAKRFGETLTAYYARDKGLDARIIRIFNTYGPRMSRADMRMIIRFINQALANEPITVFGDGTQTRSLCYVTDTVEGLVRLMESPGTKGEIVNIGSPEEHTVLEYATIVKNLTGSKSEIVLSEELPKDDPLRRRADIRKAKELLGWEPKIGLQEGLQKVIAWVSKAKYGKISTTNHN